MLRNDQHHLVENRISSSMPVSPLELLRRMTGTAPQGLRLYPCRLFNRVIWLSGVPGPHRDAGVVGWVGGHGPLPAFLPCGVV